MKTLLRLLLKTQHQQNRSHPTQTEKGMTLVELLVGAIMAFLIITPMLAFVVDMLNTDRREQVKSNTEQDIQAAVDFIAQDLSQAIYIYDNIDINGGTRDGVTVTGIKSQLPDATDTTKTPILVFWKRQQIKDAISVNTTTPVLPINCNKNNAKDCNDTYVRSLVAYYQIKETDPKSIWCQPSGGTCPTRIARYEIKEGIRKPGAPIATPYYGEGEAEKGQQVSQGFNPDFDLSKPTENVTKGAAFPPEQVLVNYLDHNTANVPQPPDCKIALGVTDPAGTTIKSEDLLITDKLTHSFYACVDTSDNKNLARVTIRGNSLRRLQTDAKYDASKSAFFPTASVQVQGRGARGN
ncbi:hypothetical protein C7B69_04180 [filamentous cyanobacterium Phorm 46]|nr:hypothetical protein C7B69_04180 [filamentous cyanobacterium Phorm 46]